MPEVKTPEAMTQSSFGGSLIRQCFWVALAYTLILICTWSIELGDTSNYAGTIAYHLGQSPFGTTDSLWEFAHLLWRPAGWLMLTLISPLLNTFTTWTTFQQAAFALILINWIAGIITVALWYRLLSDFMRSRGVAFLLVIALACAHGFILYVHSGSSYNPALACLTASVFFVRKGKLAWAALFYALSALLWIPYIFCGLGLFVLALYPDDWNIPVRESLSRLRPARAIRFTVIAFAIILGVYLLGAYARGIRSAGDFNAWVTDASHGWSQSQRALRMVTGLPRSAFYLGHDGLLYKRYLKHDPYAKVTLTDLVRASLWKLAVFYIFLAALFFALWRGSQSGWALIAFLAGIAPIMFFAVFILESGAPDRYLPVFPFVLLGVGWTLRNIKPKPRLSELSAAQTVILAFLVVVTINGLYVFAAPRIWTLNDAPWKRIAQLREHIGPKSEIILVTNQDIIEEFFSRSVFDRVSRPFPIHLFEIIEPGSDRLLKWREGFAAEAFRVWNNGGEVWMSRRFWSEKPKPEWNWVERDNPSQVWNDVYTFFQPLQTDLSLDGEDGFSRLPPSEANVRYLKPFADALLDTKASINR
jgi:hypothetical protein